MPTKNRWKLILPDWSGHDALWRNARPFALWPVGNQPLLGHWMDEAVEREVTSIEIYASDRPDQIRAYLDEGAYWSRPTTVHAISCDEKAPEDAAPIIGLPSCNRLARPLEQKGDLFRHWLELNRFWLENLKDYQLRIETKLPCGAWVGPHCRIHPTAKLIPPVWIRGRCDIGANASVGPHVCIGENAIIDEGASLQDAVILPGTMVGRYTSLNRVAADGGLLLDGKHGCRVPISDTFILSSIRQKLQRATLPERLVAALLFAILTPLAAVSRAGWTDLRFHDGKGGELKLRTGTRGWLIVRRWHWLRAVAGGRMRLIGILPRPIDWSLQEDEEVGHRLKETLPGILSLSDLHGCHSASDTDEWIHASYQALAAQKEASKLVRGSLLKLAFKHAS